MDNEKSALLFGPTGHSGDVAPSTITWGDIFRAMEALQRNGVNPEYYRVRVKVHGLRGHLWMYSNNAKVLIQVYWKRLVKWYRSQN